MAYRVEYRIVHYLNGNMDLKLRTFPTEDDAVSFILDEMDDLAEANDRYGLGDISTESIANVISSRYTIKEV